MAEKKVLVGCSFTYAKNSSTTTFFKALKGISFKNKDILVLDYSPDSKFFEMTKVKDVELEKVKALETEAETIARNRNRLAKQALEKGYDYLLSLEQELSVQPDLIQELLKHGKTICSALYFKPVLSKAVETGNLFLNQQPFAYSIEENLKPLSFEKLFPSKLLQVEAAGLGAMLIHRDILEKVKFQETENEAMQFSLDCRKKGFKIFLDSGSICRYNPQLH